MAIEARLGTANDPSASFTAQEVSGDTNDIDQLVQPFELLSTTVAETIAEFKML